MQVDANGLSFRVKVQGSATAPTIVLSNSLGTSLEMWDSQVAALTRDYRIVRYDCRGQGNSAVPEGSYSVAQFAGDILAIMDALDIGKAHWCGLSLGGMIGQWLAANVPSRFDKVILANTTCYYCSPAFWLDRIQAVKDGGMESIAERVVSGWLTADFRQREPVIAERMKAMLLATSQDGYIQTCEALSSLDQRYLLADIKNPTLVIAGERDLSTPLKDAEFIASQIQSAKLAVLDAAHISNVEQSTAFSQAVLKFLGR